jgi:hypothetical protein
MTAIARTLEHLAPDLRVLGEAFGAVWGLVGSSFVQVVAQWVAGQ